MSDAQAEVQAFLNDLVSSGVERGIQVAAYLDGKCVVDASAGIADPASGSTVNDETLFTVFSCGKGVTATVMHILAERGLFAYDDPIATYWPEFAANGKAAVTIRQALCHTAGIPQLPPSVAITDWDAMCQAIAALAPLWEPGTMSGYHSLTFGWILGELARRVDGRPFAQIVAEEICAPLNITSLYFGIPDKVEPRVATLENDASVLAAPPSPPDSLAARIATGGPRSDELFNRPEVRRAVIPAAGGIMNAQSLARHYAALVGDGVDGVRLLPPNRVRESSALLVNGKDAVLGTVIYRGLGYMLGGPGMPMGGRVTAFGHRGYGGTVGFADPEYKFAFALTKNRLAVGPPEASTLNKAAQVTRTALGIPEGNAD